MPPKAKKRGRPRKSTTTKKRGRPKKTAASKAASKSVTTVNPPTTHNTFKYVLFTIFTLLFLLIVWPFFPAIVFAVIFAVVFSPIYNWLTKKHKWNKTFASLLILILSVILILTPLILLIGLVSNEAVLFVQGFNQEAFANLINNYSVIELFGQTFDLSAYTQNMLGMLQAAGQAMSGQLVAFGANLIRIMFLFFVFLFVYFYFMRDGRELVKKLRGLLPFTDPQNKKLFNDFYRTSKTVFVGYLIAAILSGLVAYIAFTYFNIQGAVIWALLAGILSLIPTIGTILVYAVGATIVGFTMGLWGLVGLIAYYLLAEIILLQAVIKPKLVDEKISIHPILVFFAIVGGINLFGSIGIIYGPLVMVLFVSIFDFIVGTTHRIKRSRG